MRIVHVSDCYAPRTGGIESQVRDLARAQVAAGHEVVIEAQRAGRTITERTLETLSPRERASLLRLLAKIS